MYWESMSKLPRFDYSKFYSSYPEQTSVITQGDVLQELNFINLPDTEVITGRGLVLSSTCDIELKNDRKFPSRIIYAPLVKLESYKQMLEDEMDGQNKKYTPAKIEGHLNSLRKQKVGQVFYLPAGGYLEEEALVFFDTLCSCDNEQVSRDNLLDVRVLSLSAYGWHIFLEKLGLFFTRLTNDTVELRFKPAASQ